MSVQEIKNQIAALPREAQKEVLAFLFHMRSYSAHRDTRCPFSDGHSTFTGRQSLHSMDFPPDENGDVLRRMEEHGDDLTKAREIDFCFVFSSREEAIAFAKRIQERDLTVCISYSEECETWQAVVKRYMVPSHQGITQLEVELTRRAESVGGQADGWGCMQIDRED